VLEAKGVKKIYRKGVEVIRAVDDVSLSIDKGDFVGLHGSSGSGKSTLLLMLGGMLSPTSGIVLFEGTDVYALPGFRRNHFRKHKVGFLFQKFHLMPYLTVFDNIRMPLALRGERRKVDERIQEVTERLGISRRLGHRPAELSVGEQQRVAMARTLVAEPDIILADEPTGNLDKNNREIIADCLLEENRKGRIVVLATHEESLMELASRRLQIEQGRIIGE
jgi:ABC-type lipoprotein export system ATPase subunit